LTQLVADQKEGVLAARLSAARFELRRGGHVHFEPKGVIHHISNCFSIDLNKDNYMFVFM